MGGVDPGDDGGDALMDFLRDGSRDDIDRKSTRLNSSHTVISYAVFCLKKKKEVEAVVKRFKMPFRAEERSGDHLINGNIGFVVVNEMLVTGFDAPLEQLLYLSRVIRDH